MDVIDRVGHGMITTYLDRDSREDFLQVEDGANAGSRWYNVHYHKGQLGEVLVRKRSPS